MTELNTVRVIIEDFALQPFYNISIATYGMLSGISIVANWQFRENQEIDFIMNHFKIALGNVHMQNSTYYDDVPCSRVDVDNITMFYSVFQVQLNNNRPTPHSVAFFVDTTNIKQSPYVTDLIFKRLQFITIMIRANLLEKDFLFANLTANIRAAAISCILVFDAGIERPLNFDQNIINSQTSDFNFYAACLQNHLQTQMTTIIETPNEETANSLFNLLSFFLLPEQLKLSSKKINDYPVPGLFLQCICPQTEYPFHEFFQFSSPLTYIKILSKKVYSTNNFISQTQIAHDYSESVLFVPNLSKEEATNRMLKLKRQFSMEETIKPADSVVTFLKNFQKVPISFCPILCQQKLAELVQHAVLIIEISNSMVIHTKVKFLTSTQKMRISELLQHPGKEEMKMITAIAQMFDDKIYQRFYYGRQEVIKQMIVTV